VVSPDERPARESRERHYKATTACLLTDDQGLTGDLAKIVWAGMQEASLESRIKVQYLAITGPQTAANGASYYNTLGLRKCTIILAAGETPVAAMVIGADQFSGIDNIAIGADPNHLPTPEGVLIGSPNPETAASPTTPSAASASNDSPKAPKSGKTIGPPSGVTIATIEAGTPAAIQHRVKDIVADAADR
jgi:hypothetical protein